MSIEKNPPAQIPLIQVGMVQITEWMENWKYLPYTAGVLQGYVQAHAADAARYHFLLPIIDRLPIVSLAPRLDSAQIIGFSVHVWNCEYTLALAKAVKARNPKALIVFGGPHVPDRSEAFLRKHPYIDVAVHSQGEVPFLQLLEAFPGNQWEHIIGISWIDTAGVYHNQGVGPRILDLNQIPSPYLNGYFEPFLTEDRNHKWMAVWETNRGCPFSCTFCDWGAATASKVLRFDMERVQAEVDWFSSKQIEFLYLIDANFGILPRDVEIAEYISGNKRAYGNPRKVLLQMTKNQAERTFQAFKTLNEAELILSVALSLQSVTPAVLKAIKRDNISQEAYFELLKRFVNAGISTYTDILIGLPGETFASFLASIDYVISQGQHEEIRYWNTYLLPNAEMSQPEYRQSYGMETVEVPYLNSMLPARPPVDGIEERLELLVQTHTMDRQDWTRMRSLAWFSQILYFDRFLQLPLLLIHELAGISHADLLMAFFSGPLPPQATVWAGLRQFLNLKAQQMLQGMPEFTPGKDPASGVTIWMQTHFYVLNEMLYHPGLNQFYSETHALLEGLLQSRGVQLPPGLLVEALVLSQALFLSSLPTWQTFEIDLTYNIWEMYSALRKSQPTRLETGRWSVTRKPDSEGRLVIRQFSLV